MNLYRLLEDIKDGQATTSKYDNDNIQFKTPNTVMVFSNKYPNRNKLTKDRWLVLRPNNDGLKDFTQQPQKIRERSGVKDSDVKNFTRQFRKQKSADDLRYKTDEVYQESDNCMSDF